VQKGRVEDCRTGTDEIKGQYRWRNEDKEKQEANTKGNKKGKKGRGHEGVVPVKLRNLLRERSMGERDLSYKRSRLHEETSWGKIKLRKEEGHQIEIKMRSSYAK